METLPIVYKQSFLDTDFYKFTMAQAVLSYHPLTNVKYKLYCRNGSGFPSEDPKERGDFINSIGISIDALEHLVINQSEIIFIEETDLFSEEFIDYLSIIKLSPSRHIRISEKDGKLNIEIEGPWFLTIWFENILSIISELYYKYKYNDDERKELQKKGISKTCQKVYDVQKFINTHSGFAFSDFGTRRRFDFDLHEKVIQIFSQNLPRANFIGTSNVYLAKKYNLTPIGTIAHEWFMAYEAFFDGLLLLSQQEAIRDWIDIKENQNKTILLTDTLTTDRFIKDCLPICIYDIKGLRHDSGDPFGWGEKILKVFAEYKVDPKAYTLFFSDKLTIEKAFTLYDTFADRTNVSFGIGTHLTNDLDIPTADFVIKMVECEDKPVAKLSDDIGKATCEYPEFMEKLKKLII